jgi:hypothetical protein
VPATPEGVQVTQINADRIIITVLIYFGRGPDTCNNAPAQHPNKHLNKIVMIDQKLIHNNHLSPLQSFTSIPHRNSRMVLCAMLGSSGRGKLEITDVNNYILVKSV